VDGLNGRDNQEQGEVRCAAIGSKNNVDKSALAEHGFKKSQYPATRC
jgi:hypothetical protein